MKKKVNIGVVCLARKTYDFEAAFEIYKKTMTKLKNRDDINWSFMPELVIEKEEATSAAKELACKDLDGLVIITGTFHLGHLALILKNELPLPTLLWGFSELPYDGGKIRLNSVCGLNLNASNLYKAGYDDFVCSVGDNIDEDWLDAVRMKSVLNRSKIGIAGYRADGFFNIGVDDLALYSKTGILIDHFELIDIVNTQASSEEAAEYKAKYLKAFDVSGINDDQLDKVANLAAKFKNFMLANKLDGLAVRCWPEFANTYGISPCAAMSLLQSEDFIIGCEGDVEGVLSMLICKATGAETPFLADLSQVDFETDHALLWHCGVAPMNLWDGKSVRSLDTYFAAGRGVTAGFVMKPGRLNLLRIDTARGETRLFWQAGTAVEMEKQLTGTYAKVRFDRNVKDVLDTVTSTGVAHHLAMIYEDNRRPFEMLAKMMNYKWIE